MAAISVYVSLLDDQLYQFDLQRKSLGQEVLDKICRVLCIVGETDYFGLQYRSSKGEWFWVNLKNKLAKQLPGSSPYRVSFRVKYFAPPHQLLQDETRHQFYINSKCHVIQGMWYQNISTELKAKFIALMAQCSYGDYSPMLPYSKYEALWNVPSDHALILNSCRKGSSSSVSSFTAKSSRNNHNNSVNNQSVMTEDVFSEDGPSGNSSSRSSPVHESEETKVEMFRLIAQYHQELVDLEVSSAEYRFLKLASTALCYYGTIFHNVRDCFDAQKKLGVGPDGILLTTMDKSLLNKYPYSSVQKITESNRVFFLVINNPEQTGATREYGFQLTSQRAATALYRHVTETHCFFCCESVRHDVACQMSRGMKGTLSSLLSDSGDSMKGKEYVFDIRLTLREVYETARRQLYASSASVQETSQPRRSSETYSMASFRTPRNSIDNSADSFDFSSVTRPLSGDSVKNKTLNPLADTSVTRNCTRPSRRSRNDSTTSNDSAGSGESHEELELLKNELARREDCILCQICMEREMSRVFVPCGHLVCCSECALKMDLCPICRVEIKKRYPIYLPWNTPMALNGHKDKISA